MIYGRKDFSRPFLFSEEFFQFVSSILLFYELPAWFSECFINHVAWEPLRFDIPLPAAMGKAGIPCDVVMDAFYAINRFWVGHSFTVPRCL